MDKMRPTLLEVIVKAGIIHTISYLIMGFLAYTLFDYEHLYAETSLKLLMRQVNEPLVMAGPLFQPIRGALFGIVFYLLRESFFRKQSGWLVMWIALVVLGIIGTFGPTPGSFEGVIYTILPLRIHLIGLPEVIIQALLLSLGLFYWVNHSGKTWLNWTLGIVFFFILLLPLLGLLIGQP